MTGNTHKIIALRAMDHFDLEQKQKTDFLRGHILADFIPFYNYRKHYPKQSMNYVLKMTPAIKNYFELGVFAHFIADFLCTPHFNNWKLYSSKALQHLRFERKLEIAASRFDFCEVEVDAGDCSCINEKVLDLCDNAGESVEDNLAASYAAVFLMLENYHLAPTRPAKLF